MKTAIKLVLSTIAAVWMSAGDAHATVNDLVDFGPITLDTVTNLEWLDLTETTGMTYNEFLNNVGGFYAEGWRSASLDQTNRILAAYAAAVPAGPGDPDTFDRSLLGLFGITRTDTDPITNRYITSGFFGENTGIAQIEWWDMICRQAPCPGDVPEGTVLSSQVFTFTEAGPFDPDSGDGSHGYWLVRSHGTVPEPTTLALMGVGVLAVFRKACRRV